MNYKFSTLGNASWSITDERFKYDYCDYSIDSIEDVLYFNDTNTALINGTLGVQIDLNGQKIRHKLYFSSKQSGEAKKVADFLTEMCRVKRQEQFEVAQTNGTGVLYSIEGVRGRHLDVYSDKCIITVKPGFGSLITGNISDGEKTIYYVDCIGVQYKKSGLLIGYLQLETASSMMNNKSDNHFNENTFTYDTSAISYEKMEEVANYIKKQIDAIKVAKTHQTETAPVVNSASVADEILKFKQLLDMGVISQEEFDEKKKQLLGI